MSTQPPEKREVSEGTAARAKKAEEKMIPAFGKKRRKIEGWPTKRRFR